MALNEYLEGWLKHSKYVNGQMEAGENETVHIQAYVWLKERKRLPGMKKIDSHAHFEPVKFDNGASSYCLKEETRLEGPIELGEKPMLRQSQKDWDKIHELAATGRKDEIPKDVLVRHYGNICKIEKDNIKVPKRTEPKNVEWHYGATGTGKSRAAWDQYPDAYLKEDNKWWCGY